MPGAKRKIDEDTWLTTQSKKFKCAHLLANVYATTLAQLRIGARNFFKSVSNENEGGENYPRGSPSLPSTPPSSPFNSPPASPVIRDILSDDDLGLSGLSVSNFSTRPRDICYNCSSSSNKIDGWEKCYYCEREVCHANPCRDCGEGYCGDCCITKYENHGENYVCYRCLH